MASLQRRVIWKREPSEGQIGTAAAFILLQSFWRKEHKFLWPRVGVHGGIKVPERAHKRGSKGSSKDKSDSK